jgi:hypothetical protein
LSWPPLSHGFATIHFDQSTANAHALIGRPEACQQSHHNSSSIMQRINQGKDLTILEDPDLQEKQSEKVTEQHPELIAVQSVG